MKENNIRQRKAIKPPAGYENYLSRRQAAAQLGLASEFKVRQLEKAGRLQPVRGQMGSAFYSREQVLDAKAILGQGSVAPLSEPAPALLTAVSQRERRSPGRLAHDELVAQLRHPDPRVRAQAFERLKSARTPEASGVSLP